MLPRNCISGHDFLVEIAVQSALPWAAPIAAHGFGCGQHFVSGNAARGISAGQHLMLPRKFFVGSVLPLEMLPRHIDHTEIW